MSQGNRYFRTEVCDPKLQDVGVQPLISFLIRAFVYVQLGSRQAVRSRTAPCPGRLLLSRTASRSEVAGNAPALGHGPTSRRKLSHPAPPWRAGRAAPPGLDRPCPGAGWGC